MVNSYLMIIITNPSNIKSGFIFHLMIPANLIMDELKPNKMIKAYKESFREFGVSPSSLLIPKGRQEIRFESFCLM